LKKAADLKIMSVHWLQTSADDPTNDASLDNLGNSTPMQEWSVYKLGWNAII